jgi:MFS family permease
MDSRFQHCITLSGIFDEGFGGNAIVFGILSAIYPSFRLIGAPMLGRKSDTYGKKILLLSNAGTSIGWIFFLVALFLPKEHIKC